MRWLGRARRWFGDLWWLLVNVSLVADVCRSVNKDMGSLHLELRQVGERFIDLRRDVYGRVDTHQALGHPKRQ